MGCASDNNSCDVTIFERWTTSTQPLTFKLLELDDKRLDLTGFTEISFKIRKADGTLLTKLESLSEITVIDEVSGSISVAMSAANYAALPIGQKLSALIEVTIGGVVKTLPIEDFLIVKEI